MQRASDVRPVFVSGVLAELISQLGEKAKLKDFQHMLAGYPEVRQRDRTAQQVSSLAILQSAGQWLASQSKKSGVAIKWESDVLKVVRPSLLGYLPRFLKQTLTSSYLSNPSCVAGPVDPRARAYLPRQRLRARSLPADLQGACRRGKQATGQAATSQSPSRGHPSSRARPNRVPGRQRVWRVPEQALAVAGQADAEIIARGGDLCRVARGRARGRGSVHRLERGA